MIDKLALSNEIKAEAKRLGFFACGIAKAEPVNTEIQEKMKAWIEKKGYADMEYMRNNLQKRLDPTLLVPGTKSIISFALNYTPSVSQSDDSYKLSAYALGKDYHDIMKARMRKLASALNWKEIQFRKKNSITVRSNAQANNIKEINNNISDLSNEPTFRVFVDSAPVLERYWAVQAGLGWIGKNHQLIIPKAGTMFFLGEIFVDIELVYDTPTDNHCGQCTRCINACPTHALSSNPFNSSLCLSYQLIENRGELSQTAKDNMGETIYGCDRCQQACPWNRFAIPNNDPDLQPNRELLNMTKSDWNNLSKDEYKHLFKGSAVKRVKYEGLLRNIKAANKGNDRE